MRDQLRGALLLAMQPRIEQIVEELIPVIEEFMLEAMLAVVESRKGKK